MVDPEVAALGHRPDAGHHRRGRGPVLRLRRRHRSRPRSVLASNGLVHDHVVEALNLTVIRPAERPPGRPPEGRRRYAVTRPDPARAPFGEPSPPRRSDHHPDARHLRTEPSPRPVARRGLAVVAVLVAPSPSWRSAPGVAAPTPPSCRRPRPTASRTPPPTRASSPPPSPRAVTADVGGLTVRNTDGRPGRQGRQQHRRPPSSPSASRPTSPRAPTSPPTGSCRPTATPSAGPGSSASDRAARRLRAIGGGADPLGGRRRRRPVPHLPAALVAAGVAFFLAFLHRRRRSRPRRRGPAHRPHRPARLVVGGPSRRPGRRPPLDGHQPAAPRPGPGLLRGPRRDQLVRPVGPRHRGAVPVAGDRQRHRARHRGGGLAGRARRPRAGAAAKGTASGAVHRPGIVSRFSTAAAISVLALIVAGGAMGWIETGSLEALRADDLRPAGAGEDRHHRRGAGHHRGEPVPPGARHRVRRGRRRSRRPRSGGSCAPPAPPALRRPRATSRPRRWIALRRLVTYEALALVVVLGFTAVLVNTTPGRAAVRPGPRWSTSPTTPRPAP